MFESDTILSTYMCLAGFFGYLANAFAFYRIGSKAGLKNLWLAFIPFLQFILFFHIINRSAWNVLLLIIPIVNIIFGIIYYVEFYKAFGVDTLWIVLGILVPFPIGTILLFYLAFSDITYKLPDNKYRTS